MKGKILGFNKESRSGAISGDDGNRYDFEIVQWKGVSLPKAGKRVDFVIKDESAEAIYPDPFDSGLVSKKIVAVALAFFLGIFGAHKFYLGYNKEGVIMLLVSLFGFIFSQLILMGIVIIAFVEFIFYLVKSDDEFEQIYVVGHKPWF